MIPGEPLGGPMREDTARLGAVISGDDSGLTPLQTPDTSESGPSPIEGGRVVSLVVAHEHGDLLSLRRRAGNGVGVDIERVEGEID